MRERSEAPRARTSDLVVKSVGGEVLVYDLARHRAHSLNRVAAAVWRACDGTRGVDELGQAAGGTIAHPVPPDAVNYALQVLDKAHLLEGASTQERGLTRRQVMASLGAAAAVALPVVATIVAPTPAHAASCKNLNDPCTLDQECCGNGCGPTTSGCSCTFFKTFGKRCLQLTIPSPIQHLNP